MDPRISRTVDAVAAIFEAAWTRLDRDRAAGVDVGQRAVVLDDLSSDLGQACTVARIRRVAALGMVPAATLAEALEARAALSPAEVRAVNLALEARAAGAAVSASLAGLAARIDGPQTETEALVAGIRRAQREARA